MTLFFLVVVLLNLSSTVFSSGKFSRDDFPSGFIFGSGTSAYQAAALAALPSSSSNHKQPAVAAVDNNQVEGAAKEDGRTPSIFDTFAEDTGGIHGATGEIASDQYHKYKEDVQLMAETGLDAYRFSISWSRLIPNGRGPINPKGLEYYNNLINELIQNGIQPHVTLHHSDLPQVFEDEYGGWVSRKVVKDFTAFADVCFREFGDRVKHWTTFNEANVFVEGGYDSGFLPPQRCSSPFGRNCRKGNSSTEPYLAAHYILLSHASAAGLYKKYYQDHQHGLIGINLLVFCVLPGSNTKEDAEAARRAYDFWVGWFVDPLMYGDYPATMRKNVGSRLPEFTSDEAKQVKGSIDFVGVNYYSAMYVKNKPDREPTSDSDFHSDMQIETVIQDTHLNSTEHQFPVYPKGMQIMLEHFKQVYGNPPIYIHENGQPTGQNSSLDDPSRVDYYQAYIGGLLDAVRNGSNTRGYFTWSFIDVFELLDGYKSRYGLYYVDFNDPDLSRYPKLSAKWYSNFLKGGTIGSVRPIETKINISANADARSYL